MSNRPFVISTDSGSDLNQQYCQENGVLCVELSYTIAGETYTSFDPRMTNKQFYDLIRQGEMPVTQQVNPQQITDAWEPVVQQGNDILHIGFSSGLSGSFNSACMAAEELREKYPEATIITVDSLAASLGHGMLVDFAVKMKKDGASIEEIAAWQEANKMNLVHNFTVDDLNHLQRGGRVSKATAIVGTALGIKPVLHVDDEGHLINISKVRGRKPSLKALVDRMEELTEGWENTEIFISHGDCLEDAQFVADEITKRFGITKFTIDYVGPVIGSHTGCGVVALFFMGKNR
ncbi:MAG: DegV family protein [Oscillospiraceae bacterium]|nr:DegV family protein [Oscillospiraceae bacterium]